MPNTEVLVDSKRFGRFEGREVLRYEQMIKAFAIYEILAGGALFTWSMIASPDLSGVNSLIFLLVLIPIAVTVWGGISLYKLNKLGFDLSNMSLAMQIVWITGPVVGYHFYTGVEAWLGWYKEGEKATIMGLEFFGTSSLRISGDPQDVAFGIGINVVPVTLMVLLSRWRKQRAIALEVIDHMLAASNQSESGQAPEDELT